MHEMAEVMEKLEDVKKLKCDLMDCLKAEISTKGLACIDTKEAGEVVDMIKDLAETEKECMEALYYQKVTEAMVSYGESRYDGDMMGYNPNRSKTTGRYISRNMGFRPHMPYLEHEGNMQPSGYMHEAMMGYSGENRGQNQNWSNGNQQGQSQNMGYDKDMDPRYGRAYNEYRMKRRHYHETNSPTDKKEMDLHAEEHVRDIVATARDIWKDADPNLRKQMKEDFTKLVGEMTV